MRWEGWFAFNNLKVRNDFENFTLIAGAFVYFIGIMIGFGYCNNMYIGKRHFLRFLIVHYIHVFVSYEKLKLTVRVVHNNIMEHTGRLVSRFT